MDEPWYAEFPKLILHHDEVCEDSYEHAACREHDDYPDVELPVGPVVGLAHDDPFAGDAAASHGGLYEYCSLFAGLEYGCRRCCCDVCLLPLLRRTNLRWRRWMDGGERRNAPGFVESRQFSPIVLNSSQAL